MLICKAFFGCFGVYSLPLSPRPPKVSGTVKLCANMTIPKEQRVGQEEWLPADGAVRGWSGLGCHGRGDMLRRNPSPRRAQGTPRKARLGEALEGLRECAQSINTKKMKHSYMRSWIPPDFSPPSFPPDLC